MLKMIGVAVITYLLMPYATAAFIDCNVPANRAQCEAEFQANEAIRKAEQDALTGAELNRKICEDTTGAPCGGGGGAGGQ